jgi:NAD(P)-dependent dehydrogenase (short-subunit alcohol dehydrogenase family)
LVNNAAMLARPGEYDVMDTDEYLALLNVNMVAPVALTKKALPLISKTKGSVDRRLRLICWR